MKKSLVILVITLFGFGCNKDESSTTEELDLDPDESNPGELNVGGLPSEEELAEAQPITLTDANTAAEEIQVSSDDVPLRLNVTTESAGLSEDNEDQGCNDGLFCLAKKFSTFHDFVTEPVACNLKLLMRRADGSFREDAMKQVKDRPVFFVDGWGTIGIGDGGPECPDLADVETFVTRLKAEEVIGDDEPFYLPSRFVLFKNKEGQFVWKIVFFPADHTEKLSELIPPIKKLVGKKLDFAGFNGAHNTDAATGKGMGSARMNFVEMGRMIGTFDAIEGKEAAALDLTEEDEEGFPTGTISITYDAASDPQKYTTTASADFGFGDESPFVADEPTIVYRSGVENYISLRTPISIVGDDDEGPLSVVQICKSPKSGGDPLLEVSVSSVPKEKYLAKPTVTSLQMMWKDFPASQSQPDDYRSHMAVQGGPYIHGPVQFMTGQVAGALFAGMRTKTPLCEAISDDAAYLKKLDQTYRDYFDDPNAVAFDPNDGFRNMIFEGELGQNMDIKTLVDSPTMLTNFPEYEVFQFVDLINNVGEPIKTP